ncbi:MAG: creatininase family protein [Candidatus Odinarchaeota archaeon]|nr:creatininase family protein [Candidatus Odinarchaeota archaeon]
MKESDLIHLTTYEFKEKISDPNTIVVLPVGSVEQHGPHLPLLTDSIIASELITKAKEIVKDEINVIVLPILTYGCSYEHMDFPGTITLRLKTFLSVIEDIISSLSAFGVRKIAIANAHGGNAAILRSTVFEFSKKHNVFITIIELYKICNEAFSKYRESMEIGAFHAGEMETSLILHISPSSVKTDNIQKGIPIKFFNKDSAFYIEKPRGIGGFSWSSKMVSPIGVIGDPTLANKEKGKKIFDDAVNMLADILRELYHMKL